MPGFANATRGTTAERGYGRDHQRERARWAPVVARGDAYCQQGIPGNGSSGTCLMPTRWIEPGTRWANGHNDTRTAWIGPVHWLCNQRDGARRGGIIAAARRAARRHPRYWPPRTPPPTW